MRSGGCASTLKWKIQLDSPVRTVMKCLRVLIAAFERQVEAVDRYLHQRAGLDRIEILIPHPREVPPKVGGTAALFALVDQPGSPQASEEEAVDICI